MRLVPLDNLEEPLDNLGGQGHRGNLVGAHLDILPQEGHQDILPQGRPQVGHLDILPQEVPLDTRRQERLQVGHLDILPQGRPQVVHLDILPQEGPLDTRRQERLQVPLDSLEGGLLDNLEGGLLDNPGEERRAGGSRREELQDIRTSLEFSAKIKKFI